MQIEFSYYDLASNEQETKENIKTASYFPVSNISVLPFYIKAAKTTAHQQNTEIKISTVIDYPMGISDINSRLSLSKYAIKNGADCLEIVIPVQFLCNRKYDKFKEDIKGHLELGIQHNVNIKYVLEYRLFTYELLYKISQILLSEGINTIYPSTGYLLDDINDNILAAALINKKIPEMNIICNGNIWNSNQINNLDKFKLYGLKVNSINAIDLICKKLTKT
jgi:deoxyribose-phosphate aldolase